MANFNVIPLDDSTTLYVAKGSGVIRQFIPNYLGENSCITYDCLTPLGRETYLELFKSEDDLKFKVYQLMNEDTEFQEKQVNYLRRSILAVKKEIAHDK